MASKKKLNICSKRSVGAYVIPVLFTVLTPFDCGSGSSLSDAARQHLHKP